LVVWGGHHQYQQFSNCLIVQRELASRNEVCEPGQQFDPWIALEGPNEKLFNQGIRLLSICRGDDLVN
jgi:hypothetical protein